MLKVNLRKNFAQDFADKYGLTKRQVGFRVSEFVYNRAFSNGYISVVCDERCEAVLQITPIFIPDCHSSVLLESVLYDMIISGDVIKEDNQCLK